MNNSEESMKSRCELYQMQFDCFLADELELGFVRDLQSHLDECPSCARALNETRQLLAVAKTLRDVPLPSGVHERLLTALRERTSFEQC